MSFIHEANILQEFLKLKIPPVAVRLLEKTDEIPPNAVKPEEPVTVCGILLRAGKFEQVVSATAEDISCWLGRWRMGFGRVFEKGFDRYVGRYFSSKERAREVMYSIPRLPYGKFSALIAAPLKISTLEPDVVVFFCNPAQSLILTHAYMCGGGKRVNTSISGHCGVCGESIAQPYLTGEPSISVGCRGSRAFALIADDELIFSIPFSKLKYTIDGISLFKKMVKQPMISYPIRVGYLLTTPRDVPKRDET